MALFKKKTPDPTPAADTGSPAKDNAAAVHDVIAASDSKAHVPTYQPCAVCGSDRSALLPKEPCSVDGHAPVAP